MGIFSIIADLPTVISKTSIRSKSEPKPIRAFKNLPFSFFALLNRKIMRGTAQKSAKVKAPIQCTEQRGIEKSLSLSPIEGRLIVRKIAAEPKEPRITPTLEL